MATSDFYGNGLTVTWDWSSATHTTSGTSSTYYFVDPVYYYGRHRPAAPPSPVYDCEDYE